MCLLIVCYACLLMYIGTIAVACNIAVGVRVYKLRWHGLCASVSCQRAQSDHSDLRSILPDDHTGQHSHHLILHHVPNSDKTNTNRITKAMWQTQSRKFAVSPSRQTRCTAPRRHVNSGTPRTDEPSFCQHSLSTARNLFIRSEVRTTSSAETDGAQGTGARMSTHRPPSRMRCKVCRLTSGAASISASTSQDT
jgi:hypothetical protein